MGTDWHQRGVSPGRSPALLAPFSAVGHVTGSAERRCWLPRSAGPVLTKAVTPSCNQWVGELPPERLGRAYVFLMKSHKASTFLNRPYRQRSPLLSYLSEYHDPEEDAKTPGVVEMAPWPTGFDEEGVVQWDWDKCEARGGSWKKVRRRMEQKRIEPE
jgi:hypothetical protein